MCAFTNKHTLGCFPISMISCLILQKRKRRDLGDTEWQACLQSSSISDIKNVQDYKNKDNREQIN